MYKQICACERGAVHRARHQVRQDKFRVVCEEDLVFFAAADGHGSAEYCRAGLGARFAIAAAEHAVRESIPPEAFAAAVKDRFDKYVASHLARRPLTDAEAEKSCAITPFEVYGTTLLGGALYPDTGKCLFFKIGDGSLNALDDNGEFYALFEADPHCIGSMTSSVVYEREAFLAHFAVKQLEALPAAIIVNTDGYRFTGEYPVELAAAITAEDPAEAFTQARQKGEHGDDQTVVLLYDPVLCAAERFRDGVAAWMKRFRAREELTMLVIENAGLREYLTLAVKRAAGLRVTNEALFADLRKTVKAKMARLTRNEQRIALLRQALQ